jgi:hypothetical protein
MFFFSEPSACALQALLALLDDVDDSAEAEGDGSQVMSSTPAEAKAQPTSYETPAQGSGRGPLVQRVTPQPPSRALSSGKRRFPGPAGNLPPLVRRHGRKENVPHKDKTRDVEACKRNG